MDHALCLLHYLTSVVVKVDSTPNDNIKEWDNVLKKKLSLQLFLALDWTNFQNTSGSSLAFWHISFS
jgi:hypothetical protein